MKIFCDAYPQTFALSAAEMGNFIVSSNFQLYHDPNKGKRCVLSVLQQSLVCCGHSLHTAALVGHAMRTPACGGRSWC